MNGSTLTAENISVGLRIVNKQHPEWGVKTVEHDGHFWIYADRRGAAVLFNGEFHFWQIAN